eukprot:gnl/Carplike_NY0171/2251_a3038_344.p1 GENE.gnl/Carplike_NY0171/2251_a3038_344~~gnl/Carplike_NY0171/2251_a3038_344.p1  ORF type:complete len:178 (+),score=4.39 gnl/Carplike_NY0171/2251_a3038_344:64-597(+)
MCFCFIEAVLSTLFMVAFTCAHTVLLIADICVLRKSDAENDLSAANTDHMRLIVILDIVANSLVYVGALLHCIFHHTHKEHEEKRDHKKIMSLTIVDFLKTVIYCYFAVICSNYIFEDGDKIKSILKYSGLYSYTYFLGLWAYLNIAWFILLLPLRLCFSCCRARHRNHAPKGYEKI